MFERLFNAQIPDSGQRLDGVRMVKNRRGAFDITFNRDKASSIIELLGNDKRLDAVQERAEIKAMKALEKQVRVRVRKASEVEKSKAKHPKGWKYPERHTENIVAFRFKHAESRSGDPHSHSHWVLLNISYDKIEKQWKAIELRYIDRKEINEIYHAEYAKGLRDLGYDARWDGKTLEVKGVDKGIQAEFSTRGNAIEELKGQYEAKGGLSKQGKQKVQLFNRPDKPADTPLPERRAGWLSRMTEPQRHAVADVVRKAQLAVKRGRWRAGLTRSLDRLRANLIAREPSVERTVDRGRTR